eukprot:6559234-Alexandrium_andersonii.AAC.1
MGSYHAFWDAGLGFVGAVWCSCLPCPLPGAWPWGRWPPLAHLAGWDTAASRSVDPGHASSGAGLGLEASEPCAGLG